MDRKLNCRLEKLADMLCDGPAKAKSHADIEIAKQAMEEASGWINATEVQGVAVGTKLFGASDTGKPCITVYVNKKIPLDDVDNPIPSSFTFSTGEVVDLDVEEVGELEAQSRFTRRVRPIFSGLSIAHHDRLPGTLGLIVRSKHSPYRYYAMSCAHVIAPYPISVSEEVYQPYKPESRDEFESYHIGSFHKSIPLNFSSSGYPNSYDVALAELSNETTFSVNVPYIGALRGVSGRISQNMFVKVIGMVSGRSAGQVLKPNFRARLNYYDAQGVKQTAGFQNVVLCTRYSEAGDSGAAVLNASDKLVGMHIGGSNSHSIFCRIIPALNLFGVWPVTDTEPM